MNDIKQVLYEGYIIKNYKEMAKIIGEEIKSGKSKKLQLENWKRYFDFEKDGQRFIVAEIFDEPVAKNDDRSKGNRSIYIKYIEAILLRHLSKQKNFTCSLTKRQIWLELGMINNKYQRINKNILKEKDNQITTYEINHFYQRCNQKLDKILFTALKNLKNRCLISYCEQIVIVDVDGNSFIANDFDVKCIDAVKKRVLKSMGLDSMTQVIYRFKTEEFFNKVNDILRSEYEWQFTYKQYKIIYTHENIVEAMIKQDINLQKLQLNHEVIDVIDKQAENNYMIQNEKYTNEHNRILKELDCEDLIDFICLDEKDVGVYRYPSCYVRIQKMLSKELLQLEDGVEIKDVDINENVLTEEEMNLFA